MFILSGKVQLYTGSNPLKIYETGECFGGEVFFIYLQSFVKLPYGFKATALVDTVLLCWSNDNIDVIRGVEPALANLIIDSLNIYVLIIIFSI